MAGLSTRLARNSSASGTVIEENPYPSAPLTIAAARVMTASAIVWAATATYHMIAAMETRDQVSEVVEAEGHLIDSQLLNLIFDTVIKGNASFEVLRFTIGRTNEEPSFISMRITGPDEAAVVKADKDGCAPNDFYSTTNQRTFVRHAGQWLEVERQRMDSVVVIED